MLAQIPRSGLEIPLLLLQRRALRRDRQAAPGDSPEKIRFSFHWGDTLLNGLI